MRRFQTFAFANWSSRSYITSRSCVKASGIHITSGIHIPRVWTRRAHSLSPNSPEHDHLDDEVITLLNSYPSHDNATPYEIMNIPHNAFDEKALKLNFNKFAKLYHPDIKISHPLLLDKSDRFQKVLSLYKLLKNQRLKMMYDQYKIGWQDNHDYINNSTGGNHPYANSNVKAYQYYSAGTWEDYQHMKNGSPKQTLDLEKNKYNILAGVISVMVLLFLVEVIGINELKEQESIVTLKVTQRSRKDLQKLYENYGMGDDKDARIHRFLWWRQMSEILFSS